MFRPIGSRQQFVIPNLESLEKIRLEFATRCGGIV
jgi:hypothetical protein